LARFPNETQAPDSRKAKRARQKFMGQKTTKLTRLCIKPLWTFFNYQDILSTYGASGQDLLIFLLIFRAILYRGFSLKGGPQYLTLVMRVW
jgi:hypothetical protein